jgi:hypothetical protein
VAFSPDKMRMYFAIQNPGYIIELKREDGHPFDGDYLDIHYENTLTPFPTVEPTHGPKSRPTLFPTVEPTDGPTPLPTRSPSSGPTVEPSELPTDLATSAPSLSPTIEPTDGRIGVFTSEGTLHLSDLPISYRPVLLTTTFKYGE